MYCRSLLRGAVYFDESFFCVYFYFCPNLFFAGKKSILESKEI